METSPSCIARSAIIVESLQHGLVERSAELAFCGVGILNTGFVSQSPKWDPREVIVPNQ